MKYDWIAEMDDFTTVFCYSDGEKAVEGTIYSPERKLKSYVNKKKEEVFYYLFVLTLRCGTLCTQQHHKVACIGNSITYGYGLPDRSYKSYPVPLQKMLGGGPIKLKTSVSPVLRC